MQGNREQSYQRILDFLGLADDQGMRSFFDSKVLADAASIGRWRKTLQSAEFTHAFTALEQELAQESIFMHTLRDTEI
jgi:hypothetical protein